MNALHQRQALIRQLHARLVVHPAVHAAWLEGADAEGKADEYSDLDLWLDVDAGAEDEAFTAVRGVVETFGPLDVQEVRAHPHPQIRQHFYRSAGLSPFLFVDVCVQTRGREVAFGPANAFLTLFDRDGVLKRGDVPSPDTKAAAKALLARRWRFLLVEKELRRGHALEALAYYHAEVLEPLTELLRLRYAPQKSVFGLKHIYADLPAEVARELEALYALTRPDDLPGGMEQAGRWMDELALALA